MTEHLLILILNPRPHDVINACKSCCSAAESLGEVIFLNIFVTLANNKYDDINVTRFTAFLQTMKNKGPQ